MTYYCDNGKLMGHISHKVPGVEFSTGSLGHGFPVATGMAIATRYAKSDRKIICMTSDGDMNEGSTWEAIMFATQEKLSKLTLFIDYNQVQALGHSEKVIGLCDLKSKLETFGFAVREIDGHNLEEIYDSFSNLPIQKDKPSAIIAHTIKCKGIPSLEDTVKSHYRFVPDEEIEQVIKRIEGRIMRAVFNKTLLKIAEKDPRIHMVLADIGYGEIEPFCDNFPERYYNVGVAEQNMTGVACGIAMEGNI